MYKVMGLESQKRHNPQNSFCATAHGKGRMNRQKVYDPTMIHPNNNLVRKMVHYISRSL